MGIFKILEPAELPYDFGEWKKEPFSERMKMVCQAWALQGFGAPPAIILFYVFKIAIYIAGWIFFCSFSESLGSFSYIGEWWFKFEALGKAIVWTALFEVLGFGGGSGPLTGRYVPPFGGWTYFLRPGTVKCPFLPRVPILGNDKRTIIDVLLYVGLLTTGFYILCAASISPHFILLLTILLLLCGILDRTVFLAARGDIYFPMLICLLFPENGMEGLKLIWFGIWFWAAFSKLTPNFTSVICVMICNSPVFNMKILDEFKKKLFVKYPDDLRPSKLAGYVAHFGTLVEFSMPLLLIFFQANPVITFYALVILTLFHIFIFMNFPMGVPMEWNVIMVYGGWLLFGYHIDISTWGIVEPVIMLILFFSIFLLPLLGHFFPRHISFLLSMRYYAGTWGYSVWLFKGDALEKIDLNIKKSSKALMTQLKHIYEEEKAEAALTKVMAFRLMHLPGRLLNRLIPKAVENIDDYEWMDGEFIAGEVLGWNFGDAHLHHEPVLESIQKRCNFKEGELRVIMVESPKLHSQESDWRIYDACSGLVGKGKGNVREMENILPWGENAALERKHTLN